MRTRVFGNGDGDVVGCCHLWGAKGEAQGAVMSEGESGL